MAIPVLTEVKALARHLPVLSGAMAVVMLCMVSIRIGERIVRALLANGGDVTALVTRQVETLSAMPVRATAWAEQILAFLGIL